MKKRTQTYAGTSRPWPEPNAGLSAPLKGPKARTFAPVVLGSIALISMAIYFSTRPRPHSSLPPAGPPIALPARAPSNSPLGIVVESAGSSSNWDVITAGRQKGGAASELAARANALLAAGDAKGAVRLLEDALRLTPDDEDLHYNLGIAYARSGDITNAEHHYREALRLLPDYPEVHNNLGNLLMRAGRLGEAEAQFIEAIKLMPDLSTAHNSLGIVRQSQRRMPEAIACFRKAVELSTNYWQAHFNLAMASISQGAKEDGRQELEAVLRLNPGYPPARSALDRLLTQPPPSGQ